MKSQTLPRRIYADLQHTTRHIGHGRLIRLGLATLMVTSLMIPVLSQLNLQQSYRLDAATRKLVGHTNANLVKKFSYDVQNQQWQFNKSGIKPDLQNVKDPNQVAAQLKSQVGGGGSKDESLYSVDLPADGKKGITYYDNNTNLSFTLEPTFKVLAGQERDGQLIYPFQDGGKLIYSAKNNGMKEDIVLSHNIGDKLQFSYKMNLPDTLEAKILDDGSVGIYSADPVLFGNIQYGSDMDQAKIESARKTAAKDHLLFAIPAPVIKQTGSEQNSAKAQFAIEGNELKIYTNNMDSLTYPVSVDPSVVVTSTSDFTDGNNEGNIDFNANEIDRGGLTGGSVGAWHYTHNSTDDGTTYVSGMSTALTDSSSAVYNGRLYVTGGDNGSTYQSAVYYASLNSDGTIGTWTSTTALPAARTQHAAVAYNGYLYVIGGAGWLSTVYYAPINTNGSVGTWNTTSALITGTNLTVAVAHSGYLYVIGGSYDTGQGLGSLSTVQYAAINANGTVGSWSTTSSLGTSRYGHGANVYNGYLYVSGGRSGASDTNSVEYARIKSDGTLDAWTTTTSFTTARSDLSTAIYDGYIYIMGGGAYLNDVQYAAINANGTVGSWNATSSFITARSGQNTAIYSGYMYIFGGTDGSVKDDVQYAKIDPFGTVRTYTSNSTQIASNATGFDGVAYNGYLYLCGGFGGGAYKNLIRYAAINNDGTVGAWTDATNTLGTPVSGGALTLYNGKVYVLGGITTGGARTDAVQYFAPDSSGVPGTVSTTTVLPVTMGFGQAQSYNGYMYYIGGQNGARRSTVYYNSINSNGTLGATWTQTASMNESRQKFLTDIWNGYIYAAGGFGATVTTATVEYAPINSDGSIGTWQYTTSMNNARNNLDGGFAGGYFYVFGGENDTNDLSSVEYAKVNNDGTLGTWQSNTSLPATYTNYAGVMYNRRFYLYGGSYAGAVYKAGYIAQISIGGTGTTVGSWGTTTSFTTARSSHSVVTNNGYIYLMAGNGGGGDMQDLQYAKVTSTGALASDAGCGSTWCTSTNPLPNVVQNAAVVVNKGYMYVTGGKHGTSYTNVYYAKFGTAGELAVNSGCGSTWCATGSLNTARYNHSAAVYNDYLYVLGGNNDTANIASVEYAQITTSGALASNSGCGTAWCTTTSFTGIRQDLSSVALNGYIYVIGGANGSTYYNDVQYASLNSSNGTVGSWSYTTQFMVPRSGQSINVYNGYMYILGGNDGTARHNDVQYAPISSHGHVGKWEYISGFGGSAVSGLQSVVSNGILYELGGYTGSANVATVKYAILDTIARAGSYSKLVNLGSANTVTSISYNGSLSSDSTILAKTAGAAGTFGNLSDAATYSDGAITCSGGSTQYVWLQVLFNDAQNYVFGESNASALTDITVNYGSSSRPGPGSRLHGGKWFNSESLQPLDTCGA